MTCGEHDRRWCRVLEAAGVPHVGTHGVRHGSTTDIANSGVPIKIGMALMGSAPTLDLTATVTPTLPLSTPAPPMTTPFDRAAPSTWSDADFLAAFLDSTMPAASFDHHGHVRAAWLLLQAHPLPDAVEHTCDGIARLAERLGVPGKYHRTLSEAVVRLMADGGAADRTQDFATFVRNNPALMQDARGLLSRHYSPQLLATEAARRHFVAPDRLPLPR